MSEIKFTPDQLLAINTEGCDLLVSAAAGSGKTAVLTRRVLNKIISPSEKTDITDFLVVTFTVSAAADLKRKLSDGIREEMKKEGADTARLRRQLLSLSYAKIATIDSFCRFIVKDSLKELELPQGMKLTDENEIDALASEIMDEVLEEFYAKSSDESSFLLLAEAFSNARGDGALAPSLLKIYNYLINFPCPMELLSENIAELEKLFSYKGRLSLFDSPVFLPLKEDIEEKLSQAEKMFKKAAELCRNDEDARAKYLPAIEHDIEFTGILLSSHKTSYEEFHKVLQLDSPEKMGAVRGRGDDPLLEQIKELRRSARKIITDLKKDYKIESEDELYVQLEIHLKLLGEVKEVLNLFHKRFKNEKKSRKIMNFSDMSHYAFDALVEKGSYKRQTGEFIKTPYAKSLSSRFREVLIDEYQDVNALQDAIFRAVSNSKNRFMVGDIKQSIYAFRGATPEIFQHYRDTFTPISGREATDSAPKTVFLQNNYRSDENILEFSNLLFSRLMNIREEKYLERDRLVFSKKDDLKKPVEMHLFKKDRDEEKTSEADFIASEIIRLVSSGEYAFSDIAVLSRTLDTLDEVKKALDKRGIPSDSAGDKNLFSSYEVLTLISFMKAVANPTDDVYLASALSSPPFSFTPDELLEIRERAKKNNFYFALGKVCRESGELAERLREFVEFLDEMREYSHENSGDRVLWQICCRTGLFKTAEMLSEPEARRTNLITVYTMAKGFCRGENRNLGSLCDWLSSIAESWKGKNKKKSGDGVKLMTFHASKGLQFPVCFATGLGGNINKRDSYEKIVFSPFGPTLDLPFSEACTHLTSYFKRSASALVKKALTEEELRNLYVTFTRAERRLIITAEVNLKSLSTASLVSSIDKEAFRYTSLHAVSHIALVICALADYPGVSSLLSRGEGEALSDMLCIRLWDTSTKLPETALEAPAAAKHAEFTRETLALALKEIPQNGTEKLPYKLSVSAIKDSPLDPDTRENNPTPQKEPRFLNGTKKHSAAFAGTSMHTFMQFCSFDISGEEACRAEAKRLVREGFILPEHEECLDYARLAAFFESPLFSEIKNSPLVEREKRYTLLTSARRVSGDIPEDSEETVLLQGVVDCYFENENGGITLLDFKTDRVPLENGEEILRKRHASQLSLYAEALSEILPKKVDKIYVWSFSLARAVEI